MSENKLNHGVVVNVNVCGKCGCHAEDGKPVKPGDCDCKDGVSVVDVTLETIKSGEVAGR